MSAWNNATYPRRLLPTTAALAAFEAVARCRSFTRAAQELSLTQSAVSKQIAALQSQLGIELFEPGGGRKVTLTPAGSFYHERVKQVLRDLSSATAATIAFDGDGRTLRLGVPASFGSRWLIPRIDDFFRKHPDVTVEFATRVAARLQTDFDNLDASIEFAPFPDTDDRWRSLMNWDITVAAPPDTVERFRVDTMESLPRAPILLHTSDMDLWNDVRTQHGWDQTDVKTIVFEHYSMVFQAASAGLGLAFAPVRLVEREMLSGDFISPFPLRFRSNHSCFLVSPENRKNLRPLRIFEAWLFDQAGVGS